MPNLVVEGTLRTINIPILTCNALKKKGYQVELHIVSVKKEISFASTVLRYEMLLSQGGIPRASAKEHHDMVVSVIVQNIKEIEEAHIFNCIRLFNRQGKCIYKSGDIGSASIVERRILCGKWNSTELNEYISITDKICELKLSRNADDYNNFRIESLKQIQEIKSRIKTMNERNRDI